MPLFSNKFSPKKTPLRKNGLGLNDNLEELFEDNHVITLKLNNQESTFSHGEWIPENGSNASMHKAIQKYKYKVQELEEQNNMLKVKYEILLNMLTQTTAECQMYQSEIDKLTSKAK